VKNYDETRQKLKELGWRRSDRSFHGLHQELWREPPLYGRSLIVPPSISYQSACRRAGIAPAPSPLRLYDPKPSYKRAKTIQAKHLDTRKVLEFIVDHCKATGHLWTTYYDLEAGFPDWDKFPDKVRRAKMRKLVAKGYLDGCLCGCRGDFEPRGPAYYFLSKDRSRDDIRPGFKMTVAGRALRDMWWEGTAMCVQFHDTGAISKFHGARLTNYSMSAEVNPVEVLGSPNAVPIAPHITMHATMTMDPQPIEFVSINFVIGEKKE